jgi:hypothetical protein
MRFISVKGNKIKDSGNAQYAMYPKNIGGCGKIKGKHHLPTSFQRTY